MSNYIIKEIDSFDFGALTEKAHNEIFFSDGQIFKLRNALNEEEIAKWKELSSFMGSAKRINLAVFKDDELAGWSWGFQENGFKFYMCNSAILPEHRQKGLYKRLLNEMIQRVTALGFQEIYSRHITTNNSIIIPKLKAGFVITTMEVSDIFGVLVHLNYYPKELRRKMMNYRVGEIKPDEEIKAHLKL